MRRILAAMLVVTVAAALAACTPTTERQAATTGQPGLPNPNPYTITDVPSVAEIDLEITTTSMELAGKAIPRYLYTVADDPTMYGAGRPIVVDQGDTVRLTATNRTQEPTNIHWHGLHVPNDQDGPAILIEPGASHDYEFTADQPGTYWYHSHQRPVRDQVDFGMYAPLIVRDAADAGYDRDQILVLDDWLVDRSTGHMEIVGDVDTVNGRTGEEIPAIPITTGELHKLRLINASSARTQQLRFPVEVRVTHTDGMPLPEPYTTRVLTIAPAERYDVELSITGGADQRLAITGDRDAGMVIPIDYTATDAAPTESPFLAPAPQPVEPGLLTRDPDIEMSLSAGMGMRGGMGMVWTINGQAYPSTEGFTVELGRTYVIRFRNNGMPPTPHPMHIHGTHFRVLSNNGEAVTREAWKDTTIIPPGAYQDIAITFDEPGTWMVHCHILDHEDGGMMTTIDVV